MFVTSVRVRQDEPTKGIAPIFVRRRGVRTGGVGHQLHATRQLCPSRVAGWDEESGHLCRATDEFVSERNTRSTISTLA